MLKKHLSIFHWSVVSYNKNKIPVADIYPPLTSLIHLHGLLESEKHLINDLLTLLLVK